MKDNKRLKRRVRNSYIVSTVSMALVLFLLGSVGYLMTAALRVARTLQESVTVTVELADGVDSLRRGEIERRLRGDEMVRDIEFVSKQTKIGDAEFRHMFENEIEEVLGENPLNDSFEVHLSAESADSVRLDAFMAKAGGMRGVERATCPLPMIRRMHATVNKIQLVLAVFAAALLAISLILLSNTIRLSIYSKRYLINTMKLVGATKWFIMRPFLASSVWQGLAAGAGASALFGVALYGLSAALSELTTLAAMTKAMIIVGSMMAGGVALALLFTAVSVNRFVDMRSDKIHLY